MLVVFVIEWVGQLVYDWGKGLREQDKGALTRLAALCYCGRASEISEIPRHPTCPTISSAVNLVPLQPLSRNCAKELRNESFP